MLNTFGNVGNTSVNKHGPMVESGKNVSPCHFPTTNPTWTAMRLNPVLWDESSAATNVKFVQFQWIMFLLVHSSFTFFCFFPYFCLFTFLSQKFNSQLHPSQDTFSITELPPVYVRGNYQDLKRL